MSKNSFAAKILAHETEVRTEALNIGWEIGWQSAMDFIAMVLNNPDVMGAKNTLGGDKIYKITTAVMQAEKEYYRAFKPFDPEADVWQERIDVVQKKIYKDKFQPFEERYPGLKKIQYTKGWAK